MYVVHEAAADPDSPVETRELRDADATAGTRVTFHPESGKAQVTTTVGEQLCNRYDAIVPADTDKDITE
jgi:hypothetical protein